MLRKGIAPASYSLQRLVRRSSMVGQYSSCRQASHRAGFGSEWPLENSARMRKSVRFALEPSVARSRASGAIAWPQCGFPSRRAFDGIAGAWV